MVCLPPRNASPHQDSAGTAPSSTPPPAHQADKALGKDTLARKRKDKKEHRELAFTRYCHHQYCMVYGITRGGVGGGGVYCAMVVQ